MAIRRVAQVARKRPRAAAETPPPVPADPTTAFAALGLTPLEAEVYRFLLEQPGATGYRIAQGIGRPVGNIYKAVEALEAKGAVATSDDGGNRVAIGVPVAEWLQARRGVFDRACATVTVDLARAQVVPPADAEDDDLVYRLADRDQMIERCRAMIRRARQFVVASIAPALIEDLAGALQAAAQRVPVAVKCFQPRAIEGVEVILDDGLVLRMATWSRNPLLAWVQFTGLSSDLLLAAVRQRLAMGPDSKLKRELQGELDRLAAFESDASSGKLAIARRYRTPSRRTAR